VKAVSRVFVVCLTGTKLIKKYRMEKKRGLFNHGLTLVKIPYFNTFSLTISIRVSLTFRISNS